MGFIKLTVLAFFAACMFAGCAGTPDKGDELPTQPLGENSDSGTDEGTFEVDRSVPDRPQEEIVKEVSSEAQSGLNEGIAAMESGDYDRAKNLFEGLTSDATGGALANFNLGVLADRQGSVEEAKGYFLEALRVDPDFSPALVSLVRLHLRSGDTSGALQRADTHIRQRPDNMNHVEAKLLALLHSGRYEDVLREAKLVLRSDEKNTRAMIAMAGAYHNLSKYELSEDILKQVIKIGLTPDVEAEVHYRLGFVYMAMKQDGKAIGGFQKAVDLRPAFPEARNNLGVLFHKARDYDNAIGHFTAAIGSYPAFKEAYLNLGNAHKGRKAYDDAEKAFLKATQLAPSYADAYFNLGVLYLDAVFEGRDKKEQLQLAIDNFNRYKSELKAALPREDPADSYIEEAKKRIVLEHKREEMRREMLKQAEEEPIDEEGMGEDEGMGEEGMDEDGGEGDVEFAPESDDEDDK